MHAMSKERNERDTDVPEASSSSPSEFQSSQGSCWSLSNFLYADLEGISTEEEASLDRPADFLAKKRVRVFRRLPEDISYQIRQLANLVTQVEAINTNLYNVTFGGRGGMREQGDRLVEVQKILEEARKVRRAVHGQLSAGSLCLCKCTACSLVQTVVSCERQVRIEVDRKE
uniref:Uncharacterized protein n=1 Tax=Chromera velia CCMP2878 TaxID=1169474 RepID=A0A0G4HIA1_9ALVE|eukprot:Cvel_27837.t1-p1 / transcript=Cvel_27837.t1 / gene=Cvel_27837 / organism=Chromera_velia_CCMP2878 / gene_product=hypothetical protein / transcript_product=hypothetical protein / location=Cvel_scaffold3539:13489-14001(-) / protein_length=171 / sequence_SO=supercontig / SO=protein_coding / is_pseudo=false